MKFHLDFETEPIGGGNPYSRCIHCKRSVPEINGSLEGHLKDCQYRQAKEAGMPYRQFGGDNGGGVDAGLRQRV